MNVTRLSNEDLAIVAAMAVEIGRALVASDPSNPMAAAITANADQLEAGARDLRNAR